MSDIQLEVWIDELKAELASAEGKNAALEAEVKALREWRNAVPFQQIGMCADIAKSEGAASSSFGVHEWLAELDKSEQVPA